MQEAAKGCLGVALQSCAPRGFPCGFTRAALETYATFRSRSAIWQQDWTNRSTDRMPAKVFEITAGIIRAQAVRSDARRIFRRRTLF